MSKSIARSGRAGIFTRESPYADAEVTGRDTVLLEDVSNLVANLMFQKKADKAANAALDRLLSLRDACGNLIAVSIGGLEAGDGGDADTKGYIDALQQVNDVLYARADAVVELTSGTPVIRKGSLPCQC